MFLDSLRSIIKWVLEIVDEALEIHQRDYMRAWALESGCLGLNPKSTASLF